MKLISAFALFASPLVGCAGEVREDERDGSDEAAQAASAACSPAKYQEAFAHYRKAVYGAKARQDGAQVCDEVGSAGNGTTFGLYLTDVANEASAAVMTCAAFRDVIKTSPYAAPLRKELGDSLTLRSLTGELLVIRDSAWQNWTNVEKFLPGTSLTTPGNGALNAHTRIDFKANGKANVYRLYWGDDGPAESNRPATYRVVKTGAEKDPRKIVVTHDGVTETLDLRVEETAPGNWTSAPLFKACPRNAEPWDCYYSLGPGECSA